MEFEENNQTQDASFPEKPNETPAQDMPGAEAEESSRQPDAQARREKSACFSHAYMIKYPSL